MEDLAMPAAIAIAHAVASDADLAPTERRALLLDFDRVLGVGLDVPADEEAALPEGTADLLTARAEARAAHDFATSDRLRGKLAALGVEVRGTPDGQAVTVRR
ncbi:MAG: hypothetical protein WED86_05705 [Chloroflexota bacterium]